MVGFLAVGFMGSFNLGLIFYFLFFCKVVIFYIKKKKKNHSHGGDLYQDPRNC